MCLRCGRRRSTAAIGFHRWHSSWGGVCYQTKGHSEVIRKLSWFDFTGGAFVLQTGGSRTTGNCFLLKIVIVLFEHPCRVFEHFFLFEHLFVCSNKFPVPQVRNTCCLKLFEHSVLCSNTFLFRKPASFCKKVGPTNFHEGGKSGNRFVAIFRSPPSGQGGEGGRFVASSSICCDPRSQLTLFPAWNSNRPTCRSLVQLDAGAFWPMLRYTFFVQPSAVLFVLCFPGLGFGF